VKCLVVSHSFFVNSPFLLLFRSIASQLSTRDLTLLLDFYLAAERFSFNGIGIYPSWAHKGLHLDVRELRKYQPGARWIRVDSEYIKLNSENVRKFVEAPVVA